MTLEERIMEDLKEAMRNKDEAAKRGIRAIKAAILLANTDGSGQAVEGDREIKLLQKLVKTRKDSLEIFEQQGRDDLAVIEREEIAIIERYLPQQMDEAALEALLKNTIASVGATGPQDMGKVMGAATKELAGRADGKLVSTLVRKLLS